MANLNSCLLIVPSLFLFYCLYTKGMFNAKIIAFKFINRNKDLTEKLVLLTLTIIKTLQQNQVPKCW